MTRDRLIAHTLGFVGQGVERLFIVLWAVQRWTQPLGGADMHRDFRSLSSLGTLDDGILHTSLCIQTTVGARMPPNDGHAASKLLHDISIHSH